MGHAILTNLYLWIAEELQSITKFVGLIKGYLKGNLINFSTWKTINLS